MLVSCRVFRVAIMVAAALAWTGPLPAAVEIHVAPEGNDAQSGTVDKPLATLSAARDAVRALRKRQATAESIEVVLADGTYYLREPLVLDAQDGGTREAPVVYRAAAGAAPVLSGGVLLKPRWEPHRDGIFKTAVPADIASGASGGALFVNGRPQQLARYPNYDPRDGFPRLSPSLFPAIPSLASCLLHPASILPASCSSP